LISNIHSGHTEDLVLSVSPQKWLTEGDPVTLICEVNGSSTGWTFSWYTVSSDSSDHYKLLSDSSRGAGGNYTVSSAALNHTGVYVCRAEREKPDYKTTYSNKQPLWVTVSRSESQISVLQILSSVLAVCPYLLVTVVLIFKYCRMRGKTD
ncbi:hypothetical protein QQF64_025374, partial [Cirrhinus molitorella]